MRQGFLFERRLQKHEATFFSKNCNTKYDHSQMFLIEKQVQNKKKYLSHSLKTVSCSYFQSLKLHLVPVCPLTHCSRIIHKMSTIFDYWYLLCVDCLITYYN